jgi:lincosamide nucleotidyltransferase B/F
MTPDRLLAGLQAIATTLSSRPEALALLALGSCGVETARLDGFSDLDFFVIVKEEAKQDFIANLDWLTCGKPLVFAHRNSIDGWKTLDEDGVLCEFAVFYAAELARIPFAPGRVVWARDGFDVSILNPTIQSHPLDIEWTSTEALTNVLVGLKRYLRGEVLAASRAIRVDAAELVCRVMMGGGQPDPFNPWRRMESVSIANGERMTALLNDTRLPQTARGLMLELAKSVTLPLPLCAQIEHHLDLCDAG